MNPRLRHALLAAALLLGTNALAVSRQQVQQRLQYVDGPAPTRVEWLGLGAGVDALLGEIANDPTLLQGVRIRAIEALGLLGGEAARVSLQRLLDAPGTPAGVLAAAGLTYSRAFRATDSTSVFERLSRLLNHPDWLVRRAAVRALGEWKTPRALNALKRRSALETHPAVRALLDQTARP